MAVTGKLYGNVFKAAFNKEIDWNTDTIKCMLVTSIYTPDQDVHDYYDDITNEVVGTGYVAGGATITNPTTTYTGATNKHVLDCDDPSWAASTITARTAIFYDAQTGVTSTEPLICYQQSDSNIVSTAGTFTVQLNASGLVEITVA